MLLSHDDDGDTQSEACRTDEEEDAVDVDAAEEIQIEIIRFAVAPRTVPQRQVVKESLRNINRKACVVLTISEGERGRLRQRTLPRFQ